MIKEQEAFVYLWYDAPNKKYYLGKHKGTPDDSYTHSSTIWESFTKDTIPEGVTRLILAYGTDEKMCVLEHELLVNRKKRCWDRYYNESLGDPRYVDQSGENNPMYGKGAERTGKNNPNWKDGISLDREAWQKEYNKYRRTPEYRENHRLWKRQWRAKNKAETGFAAGYSKSKKKLERQGVGTLEHFMG